MIAHLRGTVLFKQNHIAVIDVNGVGYEVLAPISVLDGWVLESEVSAHICTVVREDAFQLFGFASATQKTTFETLRGVNKIGAKLALTILSHLDVNQLATAIQTKNATTLSSVPGIGKKTAERLVIEMKDRIDEWATATVVDAKNDGPPTANSMLADAESALIALGYSPTEASKSISQLDITTYEDSETLIRAALKLMLRR